MDKKWRKGRAEKMKMMTRIKEEFPELFTKKGVIKKTAPKRYQCACGHAFNKTKTVKIGGLGFGVPLCSGCGQRVKEAVSYAVWQRLVNGQVEKEDVLLELVSAHTTILKDELLKLAEEQVPNVKGNALGFLVYYGYLKVNEEKRDRWNMIEYSINPKKNAEKRYERIV